MTRSFFKALSTQLAAFALSTVMLAGGNALAQTAKPAAKPKPKVTAFGNWRVVCPPDKTSKVPCFARLTVTDTKRKINLVNWTIGFNKSGKPLMEVVSPVDVVIAPGVQIALTPGKALKLPYLTCGVRGCMSRVEVDKGLLAMLKAANSAKISISATNGKRINFDLKMTGSAKAITALGL